MMLRLASAAVLLPAVILLVLYAPAPGFLLFLSLFLAAAGIEMQRLLEACGTPHFRALLALLLLAPWITLYRPYWLLPALVAGLLAVVGWALLSGKLPPRAGFLSAGAHLLTLIYLGLPFSLAAWLQREAPEQLLLALGVIWSGDSAAFLLGRALGRHHVTARISPRKTLEGYLFGLGAALAAGPLLGLWLAPQESAWRLALAGLLLGGLALAGDLFESLLKRGAGVKDSSSLIPGHGGVLDRIDSLLLALPGYYLLLVVGR